MDEQEIDEYIGIMLSLDFKELKDKYMTDPIVRPLLKVLKNTMKRNRELELRCSKPMSLEEIENLE